MQGPSRLRILLAFAVIYVVWGSTYLGILWAIEDIPPLLMAGSRFLLAGTILWFATSHLGGRPTLRDVGWAFVLGALMLLMGNGFLSVAETEMPTGVAALLIASVPLWIVVLEAFTGRRPNLLVGSGLFLGFAGVALLATAKDGWASGEVNVLYVALVLLGSFAWAVGSLLSRRNPMGLPMLRGVGLQMAAGGILLLIAGLVRGEASRFDGDIGDLAAASWLYLVLFGSVLAFSCYSWLLRIVPAGIVGTYAFVNPIVAVGLGAIVLGEQLTPRTLGASLLIVCAVAAITMGRLRKPKAAPPPAPAAGPDGARPAPSLQGPVGNGPAHKP